MDIEKISEKLPDFHFDWYARLLPGSFALMLFIYKCPNSFRDDAVKSIPLMAFIAYLIGHVIQPLSSWLVSYCGKIMKVKEKEFAAYKLLDAANSEGIGLVKKAHAEAVSMFSMTILALSLFFLDWDWILLCLSVLFFWSACERICAKSRKIEGILLNENAIITFSDEVDIKELFEFLCKRKICRWTKNDKDMNIVLTTALKANETEELVSKPVIGQKSSQNSKS